MEDEMRTDEFNNTILPMRGELKGLACRLAGDTCTAEDMVQEVMLRLWSMRDSLDTDGHNRASPSPSCAISQPTAGVTDATNMGAQPLMSLPPTTPTHWKHATRLTS